MAAPDIDFRKIRPHRGAQANAFEELCCQLAADEAGKLKARFVRKGPGADAGVEAFAMLSSGDEIGWQVKYYTNIDQALTSLSDSLATAMAKHPKLTRFIACLPIDFSDGRKDDTTTALGKWEAWKADELVKAPRPVEIEPWPAHDLRDRLMADPRAAGRIAFWFDDTLLTPEWFERKLERSIIGLGRRYSRETNVELPIRRAVQALTRDPLFDDELDRMTQTLWVARTSITPTGAPSEISALAAVDAALVELRAACELRGEDLPQDRLVTALTAAQAPTAVWRRECLDAAPRASSTTSVSRLYGSIRDTRSVLDSDRWRLINARRLLLTGEGGRGKSHLLADACRHQVEAGRPALLVIAHLVKDADPWREIVNLLDLPTHVRAEEFLSALDTAAKAQGVRALVVIDGINEHDGQRIWSRRLASFLHDAERYRSVSVVLSCRTTYIDVTVPPELDEKRLPRLEHRGFSSADAEKFLDLNGVTSLVAPWPLAEFDTPLFLKTLCDGLKRAGQSVLPRGSSGVSKIFDLYAAAVAEDVELSMGLNRKLKPVKKVIAAFAEELARLGETDVLYDRADRIVSSVHRGDGTAEKDVLFQLVAAGLLATEFRGDDEVVRFTFERFGDFAIAASLVEGCKTESELQTLASGTGLLNSVLRGRTGSLGGVLEALAVLLPERFCVELPDLSLPSPADLLAPRAFLASLTTRDTKAFTDRTWELIRAFDGADWDTRIRLASEPDFKENADALHERLKALAMPERDAMWSVHLATHGEAATELIDWTLTPRTGVLERRRAELLAVTLTWFFTCTDRAVRDRATKALVTVLVEHPGLVKGLLDRFLSVDDGYVVERLLCAVYGAALQNGWDLTAAGELVTDVERRLFRETAPPLNCLTREHGRLLVRWAIAHGALPSNHDITPSEGPYFSPWPLEHVPDAVIASYTCTYRDGYVSRDEIVSSCVEDGDFARYVLDRAVDVWSYTPRGVHPLLTREALHERWERVFLGQADAAQLAAYDALRDAMSKADQRTYGEPPAVTQAKAGFEMAIGSDLYERWREEAENWRRVGMYQRPAPRDHAEFNLAWARRWVCFRAHQLGWSEKLHGAFDVGVRNDRMSHDIERIGKKYQWLALYELRARLADHLEPVRQSSRPEPDELRAIDPSLLAGAYRRPAEDDLEADPTADEAPWHRRVHLPGVTVDDAIAWRDDEEDLPDGLDWIEADFSGQRWLAVNSFGSWRGGPDAMNRQLSRWCTCVVVPRRRLNQFKNLVQSEAETDHDSFADGDDRVAWRAYLGEHPWLWKVRAGSEDGMMWKPRNATSQTKGVRVRTTTLGYLIEASGYDKSIVNNIDARLPTEWLIKALGLRLGDGRAIEYVDASGRPIYRDPTAMESSVVGAYVERDAFLSMLGRDGMAAVWLVDGEKNVYGGGGAGNAFGGRRRYARLAHSIGGDLTLEARSSHLHEPSKSQLKTLRLESPLG
jgi:hypothetical protein